MIWDGKLVIEYMRMWRWTGDGDLGWGCVNLGLKVTMMHGLCRWVHK